MFKRIISVVLSLALILTTPSVQAYSDTVRPVSDSDGYSSLDWSEDYGIFGNEVTEIEENTTISEDTDYSGTVNIRDGKKLIFESGYITVSEGAVINGDIEIRGSASVNISGTVNGTVTLKSDSSPGYRVGGNGVYERQSNLILYSIGVCDSIIISSTEGFAGIGGSVGSLTVAENAVCDFSVWSTAAVDTVSFAGADDLWIFGRVGEIYVKSGHLYLEDANVSRVYVEDGANFQLYGSSRVSELYVSGIYAYIHNEGRIDNLFSLYAPVYNYGEIGSAYVYDSHPFVSDENKDHSYSSPYIIENLIIEDSSAELSRNAASSLSDGLKYGAVTFSGGDIAFLNTVVESVYAHGSIDGVALENVMINSAFLDLDLVQDISGLNIAAPDRVFILNAEVSKSFFDKYYSFLTAVYGNKFGEVDVKEVIDTFITVKDIENKGVSAPSSLSLSAGDHVSVSLENGHVPAAVSVSSPDGSVKFATMGSGSFTAEESGNYKVTVYGGYYGCSAAAEKTRPLTTRITAYTGEYLWDENGAYISKSKTGLSSFDFYLYDETQGRAVNYFSIDRNGLLTLSSEYAGHVIRLIAVHDSINWGNYWGYAPCEVSFAAGSGQIEFTALPYGEFSGYINGGGDFSVYMYDSDGKYFGKADVQEDSFQSAERMPNEKFQLVIIDDPAGFYCFRRLSDFIRNGLISGRDFVQLEYSGEPGVHEDFYIDRLPQAPVVQSPYIDYANTMFKSHAQSAVQGGMVEFTLLYAFTGDESVSDAYAEISLPEGCEALGEIGSVDGILTLPLDLNESSVSFTVVSDVENQEIMLNASLRFYAGVSEEYAYIGASGYSVVNLSMYAPTATGKSTVTLSGFATPGQTVTIYDGDYAVAKTSSGENGFWACESPLSDAYGKYHDLTAVLYDGTSKEMRSDTKTVYSSSIVPVVEEFKFSYYVHGHSASVTLSGDQWGKTQWSYDYWPGSIFTFEVKLTNSSNIERMWISSNSDGRYYTIDGYYDQESGKWIAAGQFCEDENYMPGGFAVGWQLKEDEVTSILNRVEELTEKVDKIEIPEITEEDISNFTLPEGAVCDISGLEETEDGFSGVVFVDVTGDEAITEEVQMTFNSGHSQKTVGDFISEGYILNDAQNLLYRQEYDENTGCCVLSIIAVPEEGETPSIPLGLFELQQDEKIPLSSANDNRLSSLNAGSVLDQFSSLIISLDTNAVSAMGKQTLGTVTSVLTAMVQALKAIDDTREALSEFDKMEQDFMEVYNNLLNMSCGCQACSDAINAARLQMSSAYQNMSELHSSIKKDYIELASYNIGAAGMSVLIGAAVGAVVAPWAAATFGAATLACFVAETFVVTAATAVLDTFKEAMFNFLRTDMLNSIENRMDIYRETNYGALQAAGALNAMLNLCKDGCKCNETTTTTTSTVSDTSGSSGSSSGDGGDGDGGDGGGMSGEDGGNPDNPGKNPDPSGYVYEAVESNRVSGLTATVYYQNSDRSEKLWNAAGYDQVNPQLTDEEGRYGWMVPFGFWKVRITGDGYEDAESQWLQVPPPRVDVNIAVTSLAPAKVLQVNICEDFVQVEFDKYMDVDTMGGVIVVDGKAYDAVPVNEELSGLGDGRVFATVFRAMLDTKAVNSQSYSVKVGSAQCYANIASEEYSGTVVCAPIATSLSASIAGGYAASGSETTISVKLEAVGGFEGIEAPQVTFDDPEMAQVVSVGAVDASGNVDITVRTKMAGVVNMNVSVPGSAVRERIALPVVREQDTQLRKAISSQPTAKDGGVSMIVIIAVVLAAVLFICIAANITVTVIRSRKKKSSDQV